MPDGSLIVGLVWHLHAPFSCWGEGLLVHRPKCRELILARRRPCNWQSKRGWVVWVQPSKTFQGTVRHDRGTRRGGTEGALVVAGEVTRNGREGREEGR